MTAQPDRSRWLPDALATLALVALWALYFWRLFTPSDADTLSLREGDFSGQFVAFFSYQVERLGAGEVPLWNPYNYAGHPFLADTQSAVFYPPRLLTVALVNALGRTSPGELYAALQSEMALHVLLAALLMYAFVRRLTAASGAPRLASITGGLIAALTYAFGGYLASYPPLQLAVLEAGVWLPLALLAIFEATRAPRPGALCLALAGVALGFALLAGHPQTALFALYLALAFLGWRVWQAGARRWRVWLPRFILSAALIGLIAGGLAAVQLLPGLEYLRHTSRSALPYAEKAHGFPPRDLLQVLFPGVVSQWSPLYVGVAGLALALIAVWRRAAHSVFFALAGLAALVWSFGAGTAIFDALYLLGPGVSWFRGQERAAYLVAQCAAILAGLGAASLIAGPAEPRAARRLSRTLWTLASFTAIAAGLWLTLWLGSDQARYEAAGDVAVFATAIAALSALLLPRLLGGRLRGAWALLIVALVWMDLFSVTRGGPNYEPVRAGDRLVEPAYLADIRADLAPGARVDGLRGIFENYGTLYHVPDIRTISPLRLEGVERILALPDDRAWELLAVQTVLIDWEQLMAPSVIVGAAQDALGPFNIHRLADPRPFAQPVYRAEVIPDENAIYARLGDPATGLDFIRSTALLAEAPGADLPADPPKTPGTAAVTQFEPERITIDVEIPAPAILTLALPAYSGWQAAIDGERAPLLRAYGGLSAVALPDAGTHTVTLAYHPATFTVGALISVATLALLIGGVGAARRARRAA